MKAGLCRCSMRCLRHLILQVFHEVPKTDQPSTYGNFVAKPAFKCDAPLHTNAQYDTQEHAGTSEEHLEVLKELLDEVSSE